MQKLKQPCGLIRKVLATVEMKDSFVENQNFIQML